MHGSRLARKFRRTYNSLVPRAAASVQMYQFEAELVSTSVGQHSYKSVVPRAAALVPQHTER
eukprot:2327690-Rhodomonas_salina.2